MEHGDMKTSGAVAALLGMWAVSSCGGGGGSCEGAAACGGEVNPGRYRIASYCSSVAGTVKSASCPAGITVQNASLEASGTITFNADKTYQSDATLTARFVEIIPAECLRRGTVSITCTQLDEMLQQPASTTKGSCSGTSSCTCNLTLGPQHATAMGSYSTSDTILTTVTSAGSSSRSEYCATPGSLTLISDTMSGLGMPSAMQMLTGKSILVLARE
jgi:hypothetical protein